MFVFLLQLWFAICIKVPPRIFFAPKHSGHRNGASHPESPSRLDEVCIPALRGLGNALTWHEIYTSRSDARAAVERVHAADHVDRVERFKTFGGLKKLGPDTYIRKGSFDALLAAQSSWLEAVDFALAEPGRPCWALARPPGHHAGYASADGFCVFNFCAAACAYALDELGLAKVAILDWDAHHGNGVAEYVDSEPRASYASVHQAPLWPGTGDDPTDRGPLANRLSAPVPRGATGNDYAIQWQHCLDFVKQRQPELILISAGFDALQADPLVQCSLQPSDFTILASRLKLTFPNTPLVLGLEGGYSAVMGQAIVKSLEPWLLDSNFLDPGAEAPPKQPEQYVRLCAKADVPAIGEMRRFGRVFVCVDVAGRPHVICDKLPPLGAPVDDYGDFDAQIGCIADRASGQLYTLSSDIRDVFVGIKYYIETGDVRGARTRSWRCLFAGLNPPKMLAVAACRFGEDNDVVILKDDLDRLVRASTAQATSPIIKTVPITSRLDELARSGPIVVRVDWGRAQVRASCRSAAEPSLELGYYLVRTPTSKDPPTHATDKIIADLLHNADLACVKRRRRRCAEVAAGVAVFVHPSARGRKLGQLLFKQAMRACRQLGFDYMLFIERDTGSGRLVAWYRAMGFVEVPPDALPGLDRAMIGELPDFNEKPAFYDVPVARDITILPFSSPPRFLRDLVA